MSQNISASYIVDISLGVIDVTSVTPEIFRSIHDSDGIKESFKKIVSAQQSTLFLGSELQIPRPSSGIDPFSVIAFKGLLYDKNGTIVKGGVEGFIPITTIDSEIHLINLSSEQNYSVKDLNSFSSYPWIVAIDSLLDQMLPEAH